MGERGCESPAGTAASHGRVRLASLAGALSVLLAGVAAASGASASAEPVARALTLSYSLPQRFGLDANRDGLLDSHDTAAEVRPNGWIVTVRIAGCRPAVKFSWTVNGRAAAFTPAARCAWRRLFRAEGSYGVRATEVGRKAPRRSGRLTVAVQDWLILGLGDSVASGEGVPDVPGRGGRWQDTACHRSARSFQAVAARRLEAADQRTSVTFLHLACSGATLDDVLAKQLAGARTLTRGREIDAVLLSAGANDLQFGPLAVFCASRSDCPNAPWGGAAGGPTLAQLMPQWVAGLDGRYAALAAGLRAVAPASRTYLTEYFDPLHDAAGSVCTGSVDVGGQVLALTAAEAQWLLESFLAPLNRAVAAATSAHAWTPVTQAASRFGPHGYCATDPWVVRYEESLLGQGDANGTLHPNQRGHEALAELAYGLLRRDLYPAGRARPPG